MGWAIGPRHLITTKHSVTELGYRLEGVMVSDPCDGWVVRAQAHLVGCADLSDLALVFVPSMRFHRFTVDEYFHDYQPIFFVENINLPFAILRQARTLPTPPTLTNAAYAEGPSAGGFSGGPVLNEKGHLIGTFIAQYDDDSLCRKGFVPAHCLRELLRKAGAGARSHRENLRQVGAKKYYTGITVPAPACQWSNPPVTADGVGDWGGPQVVNAVSSWEGPQMVKAVGSWEGQQMVKAVGSWDGPQMVNAVCYF